MIGRIAHSVRLLLRIGEMAVPSILGRRGCAPVIGPSDEALKAQNAAPTIASRSARRVSVCMCVLRQRRVRVLCLPVPESGEHARGFTPSHMKICLVPWGLVTCLLPPDRVTEYLAQVGRITVAAIQAQLNSYEKLVRLRDSPGKRPPLRTCQRRHNRASPHLPNEAEQEGPCPSTPPHEIGFGATQVQCRR
jgi:hypothetical protein